MKIWIGREAIRAIEADANSIFPLETGGVLLGWRKGEDRVLIDIIGPGLKALHGRVGFFPDHKWQVSQIDHAFLTSNGDLDYLGDWHTHPDGAAQMSLLDRKTLSRISRRIEFPIMLIVAGAPNTGWKIGAWTQQRNNWLKSFEPIELDVQTFDTPPRWSRFMNNAI